jgi:serpin B
MRSPILRSTLPALCALAVLGCNGDPATEAVSPTPAPPVPGELLASDLNRDLAPDVDFATIDALTESNRAFAMDLYQELAVEDGNLFLSPHSISLALAMTYAGARGTTASEMATALHFDLPEAELHPAFNALDLELATREQLPPDVEGDPFRLSVVNQTFGQTGFGFETPFLDTLAVNYGAGMHLLDFAADPEGSRTAINEWVEDHTEDRIEDLLPAGSITNDTKLVLANAIYFKASWAAPFDPANTSDGAFTTLDGTLSTVPMMHTVEPLPGAWAEGDGWVAARLPYVGEQLGMGVLVPDAGRFTEIESSLDGATFDAILDDLTPAELNVTLPKFGFEDDFDLVPPMEALGMEQAFTGEADFSGMTTESVLRISGILHKSFIDVNEEGTEAAAATAVVMTDTAIGEVRTIDVDRPFLFWVYDVPTGALLFVGRVVEP